MTILTKAEALKVIGRAYGSDHADSVAEHLPDEIYLDDAANRARLFELGLTPDRLFNALGVEL